jgi:long-subunit acyl-CoA synthetase (AMP-forming)
LGAIFAGGLIIPIFIFLVAKLPLSQSSCSSGFAVGLYTTNSPEACLYVAADSRTQIIVVEDEKQLKKILQIKSKLPDLKGNHTVLPLL